MKSGWAPAVSAAGAMIALLCFWFIKDTTNRDGAGAHVSCAGIDSPCTVWFSRQVDRPTALVRGTEVRLKSVGPDCVEIEAAGLWGLLWTTTTRVPIDGEGAFGGLGAPHRMAVVDFTAGQVTVEFLMSRPAA
ncbi:hypothetical protein ABZV91_05420 [Nocardia sp. NPDC004568]|uniref:hypothetical protein n=1 Tax=Nocardia sp. NPDC004568 TaxID=3154551 RepID=UPI0033A66AB6